MTYEQIFNEYVNYLWSTFQYDMNVFSQPWMYWWLLIPALAYLMFFMFKWVVLTAPIWLPLRLILDSFMHIFKKN